MKQDSNEFFREATMRICSNLQIELALSSLLDYLKCHIPVEKLLLQHFSEDYNSLHTIAAATEESAMILDQLIPLNGEARKMVMSGPPDGDAVIIENPETFPVMQQIGELFGEYPSSILILALRTDKRMLGYLALITSKDIHFKAEHASLMEVLRDPMTIALSNALRHLEVISLNNLLSDDNRFLHEQLHHIAGDEIIGADFGLRHVMDQAMKVAPLDSPVLILGETGTGKDVTANAIHYASSRNDGPFISVNCGAIPEALVDSELFGHEKGAFTGALSQKRGRFERANTGTIFLDEVGDLPLPAQVRLLRVLQSKEIERVGGVKTIPLDIRVIAATNRNLEEMIKNQEFREDLWFRLNVFPIKIPPLRERPMDIPALIQHFIRQKAKDLKLKALPTFSDDAIEPMISYSWPGNVRELQNVIERALILNPSGPLKFDALLPGMQRSESTVETGTTSDNYALDFVIANHIRKILEKTEGKIHGPHGAAALLGVNASTLRSRMNKLGINYGKNKNR